MCKKSSDVVASNPKPSRSTIRDASKSISSAAAVVVSLPPADSTTTSATGPAVSYSLSTSLSSFASVRDSLRETPTIFSYSDILSATNSFRSPRLSPTSPRPSWRCSVRGLDAAVIRHPFVGDPSALPSRLSAACRSYHASVASLIGASLADDGHIYLVYRFIPGATLSHCLRNPRNNNFTLLSSWVSRVQVAADISQGLEYIHHYSSAGEVHNRIKSSSIIVTEPDFRAKILHYAAAELSGELSRGDGSQYARIEGTRGYMAPELTAGSKASQKSDVYALGVVLLELISGKEALMYRYDTSKGEYTVDSVVETAKEAVRGEGDERFRKVRRWVDVRLKDSFPVEAAARMVKVAVKCVEAEEWRRPDMVWVAGKVSRLLLDSKDWEEKLRPPMDFSASFAPR